MKTVILTFYLLIIYLFGLCQEPVVSNMEISIIPKPAKLIKKEGSFIINSETKIVFDISGQEGKLVASMLADKLNIVTGFQIPVVSKNEGSVRKNEILFTIYEASKMIGNESYEIKVDKDYIIVSANQPNGLFYGMQTICQLLPEEIESNKLVHNVDWAIPAVEIEDAPEFSWRGMHLDVGRHFFSIESIKKYIDYIAFHKMNVFHWHLTEDQGWRAEIKKYPKLTEISAWRKETLIGHLSEKPHKFNGKRYGGYYSREDMEEIVQYAKERYITVVPEIEMPGHSVEVLAAYPNLGCTGGPYEVFTKWGITEDVFCAGNESVYEFLENVLSEIMEIFPSEYIHIGGDECLKNKWKSCSKCQAKIKTEGLRDEYELQSYFIKRIEKYLNSKGRKMIGWDEILEGGVAPNAAVMSWRGTEGGEKAAKMRHNVVMSPYSHCYFDRYQGPSENEPLAFEGIITAKKVYSYNPIPTSFSKEESAYILGAQGNVWTEYIPSFELVEFRTMPRMTALAEVLWTPENDRSWEDFSWRLNKQFLRFKIMNVNYYKRKE